MASALSEKATKMPYGDATHDVSDNRIAICPTLDASHALELPARKDGTFVLTNERTGKNGSISV